LKRSIILRLFSGALLLAIFALHADSMHWKVQGSPQNKTHHKNEVEHSIVEPNSKTDTLQHQNIIEQLVSQLVEDLTKENNNNINKSDTLLRTANHKIAVGKSGDAVNENENNTNQGDANNIDHSVIGITKYLSNNDHERTNDSLLKSISALENAEEVNKEKAIRNLWVIAADLDAPEEALEAFNFFIMQKNQMAHVELAEFAIKDLMQLKSRQDNVPNISHIGEAEKPIIKDNTGYSPDGRSIAMEKKESENNILTSNSQKIFASLNDQAINNPDEINRRDAIRKVSLLRSKSAVDVLLAAADDINPKNRYIALKALWYSAADGLETEDNLIWLSLKNALSDIDPNIVNLAQMALEDLERL